jgi:putative oxidoreductase
MPNEISKPLPMMQEMLLIGRCLLSVIFLHEGFTLAAHFSATADAMAQLSIPLPMTLAVVALQIFAGLSLALGLMARLGALLLGLFCLATATMFHTNLGNHNELLHFEKDLAIAGGMFVLVVAGAGELSIDRFLEPWLLRRFVRPQRA